MMISFLYNISKDSQSPNFVCYNNTVEKKVCHQQHTNIFQIGPLFDSMLLSLWCSKLDRIFFEKKMLQQSFGCSKHNKMEDQNKFDYMHT
jgi:hypothetical protein